MNNKRFYLAEKNVWYQDKDLAALALIYAEDAELAEPPHGMNAQNAQQ